jgi:hypothetical protein
MGLKPAYAGKSKIYGRCSVHECFVQKLRKSEGV